MSLNSANSLKEQISQPEKGAPYKTNPRKSINKEDEKENNVYLINKPNSDLTKLVSFDTKSS